MPTQRTGQREWLILAITAVSVAALIGAGVSSHSDPDLAGRASLARLSGEVASGVTGEWERLRRDPKLLAGDTITWAVQPAPPPEQPIEILQFEENVVARALLSEARRLDQGAGGAQAALDVVLEALGKSPGQAMQAEARLQAIQLAVRAGRLEVARDQWQRAQAELTGLQHRNGTSHLLLCALAAGPALSLEERAAVRDELVQLWTAGTLALPAAGPLREAFRTRLQALVPEAGEDARLARSALRERASELAGRVGQTITPATDGGLCALRSGNEELLYHLLDEDTVEGRFVPVGTLAEALLVSVRQAGLLPDDFTVDFEGNQKDAGPVVRERVTLKFGAGTFVLRHANPDEIISAVGDRQALLRAALFALALAVGVAGFSVFRALRRERYLGELKSAFVANVSHELRTPVSSILLMAENLENERVRDSETQARYHRLIRREAGRLRRLVDDVLDFSRIERGKGVHLSLNELDVQSFAHELEEEARERVSGAGGELAFERNGTPDSVLADEDALRRATLNLVENALRHSGVKDVELKLASDDSGGLTITVRDRGRGVPAARLESLFAPFERLEERLGDAGGSAGTGLGLAIVREIAEGHGGTASARLPEGPGLVFEIKIPARPLTEPATMETQ